jgi:hypothetical protein
MGSRMNARMRACMRYRRAPNGGMARGGVSCRCRAMGRSAMGFAQMRFAGAGMMNFLLRVKSARVRGRSPGSETQTDSQKARHPHPANYLSNEGFSPVRLSRGRRTSVLYRQHPRFKHSPRSLIRIDLFRVDLFRIDLGERLFAFH